MLHPHQPWLGAFKLVPLSESISGYQENCDIQSNVYNNFYLLYCNMKYVNFRCSLLEFDNKV